MPKWIYGDAMSSEQPEGDTFRLPDSGISLEDVEKNLIQQALKKANYNKSLAAKLLNISYDTLRYQVKKFGLE
jgi:transcriptional regulator with PAS, ATPase and Fis domain